MKLKSSILLAVGVSCGAAFGWGFVRSRSHHPNLLTVREAIQCDPASLEMAGTIGPAITVPIDGEHVIFTIPANTLVKRGAVIGLEDPPSGAGEMADASQELRSARSAWIAAEQTVQCIAGKLAAIRDEAAGLSAREAQAESAQAEAAEEWEHRDPMVRFEPAAEARQSTDADARQSMDAAVESIRLGLATSSAQIDELEAKAQAAQAELREAARWRDAAKAAFHQLQSIPHGGPIVAPVEGVLIAAAAPGGVTFGIAADLRQLVVRAMIRPADLMDIRMGQEAAILVDRDPSMPVRGRVTAISETPVDLPDGLFYPVTISVENPPGECLSGAAAHVRLTRSSGERPCFTK